MFVFDFVVKQKLFNSFVLLGCVPLMAEHTFTKPWPRTFRGRNPTPCTITTTELWLAPCTRTSVRPTHNCGQVASDTAGNMTFYSQLSTAMSGRTSVLDMNSLLTSLHLLLTGPRVTNWWRHVDTHANPARGRQSTSCKLAKRLGIPLEWVKFPFVPACMADAGPTEWLKFFKTFA